MREKASVFALLSVSSLMVTVGAVSVVAMGCSTGPKETAFQRTVRDIGAMPVKVSTVHIQADGGLGYPAADSGTSYGNDGIDVDETSGTGSSSSKSPFGSFGLGKDTLPGLSSEANGGGGAAAGPNPGIAGGTQNAAGISGGTRNGASIGGGATPINAGISGGTASSPGGGGGGSVGGYVTAVCRLLTAYCRNITSCISEIADVDTSGVGGQATSQVAASCDTLADTCNTSISASLAEASYVAIPSSVVAAVNCIADAVETVSCDSASSIGENTFSDCNFTVPSDSSEMTSDSE